MAERYAIASIFSCLMTAYLSYCLVVWFLSVVVVVLEMGECALLEGVKKFALAEVLLFASDWRCTVEFYLGGVMFGETAKGDYFMEDVFLTFGGVHWVTAVFFCGGM